MSKNPTEHLPGTSVSGSLERTELRSRIETLEARVRELEAEREALRESGETRLRASEERYRLLFDSIDQGFCIIEVLFDEGGRALDYRFVEVNAAFQGQTGLENAVGKRMRALRPDHEEHWFEIYGRVARTGEPIRFENRAAALGRWYDVYAFQVGEPAENLVGVLFSDATERKETEDALREAKRAAERASQAKSRFLSTMNHDLRTPLQAVLGLSKTLEVEAVGPLNDHQKDCVARIQAAAEHLVGMIDEILTFSRSEAGKEELRVAAVDVVQVARGTVDMLAYEATSRGLDLRLHGADERLVVATDEEKVRQILTNLVSNALKYTEEGKVDVELQADDESIELRVRDTGPGIPDDRLEEIFEPFTRLNGATSDRKGTGLGLAICRRLARLLGGDVDVRSTPGQGSTFTLRLPGRATRSGGVPTDG